jgi:hypothetical protein
MTGQVLFELVLEEVGGAAEIHARLEVPGSESAWSARVRPAVTIESLAGDGAAVPGQAITDFLFGSEEIRTLFGRATREAGLTSEPLRVRLILDRAAGPLLAVPWEAARHPGYDGDLADGTTVLFSRTVRGSQGRAAAVGPRPRAVIAVANPVDVEERLKQGLFFQGSSVLPERLRKAWATRDLAADGGAVTLARLVDALEGGCDVLVLAAHGWRRGGEMFVGLEGEGRTLAAVPVAELANAVRSLAHPPALVVLASCHSLGGGRPVLAADVASTLGLRLLEAGVTAVVGMQGSVAIASAERFVDVFFTRLAETGSADWAAGAGRRALKREGAQDWMVPALYLQPASARLPWPSVAGGDAPPPGFAPLVDAVEAGTCCPVIGPGFDDHLTGGQHALASRLAEENHFPLMKYQAGELAAVARFLGLKGREFAFDQIERLLTGLVRERFAIEYEVAGRHTPLVELLSIAGRRSRRANPHDPHRVLASLGLPIYLTMATDDCLRDALVDIGREPVVRLLRWNGAIRYDPLPGGYRPTPARPLVFHLYGHWNQPDSVVLTEEDELDLVARVSGRSGAEEEPVPVWVVDALARFTPLFVGFHAEQRPFRVILHVLGAMMQGSAAAGQVAVQVHPSHGWIQDEDGAKTHLETVFARRSLALHWTDVEPFCRDLAEALASRRARREGGEP